MPVNTKWFQDRLADQRMSQRGLARAMGLDPAAISLTLRGKREMKIAEAAAIARLLGVPADEVMEQAGVLVASKGKMISVSSFMDATAEVHGINEQMTIPHPGGDLPDAISATQCRTAGTELDHMDGWFLFSNTSMDGSIQPEAVGRLSMVRMRNGVITIAKLMRGIRRGRWNLVGPVGSMRDVEVEWAKPILLVIP